MDAHVLEYYTWKAKEHCVWYWFPVKNNPTVLSGCEA